VDAWKNQLFFGDNLEILRSGRIPVGSVDLIYLDPPFNSNATYNILFAEKSGEKSAAAGFYVPEQFPEHRFPKLQILTIAELFAGKKLNYPQWAPPSTFKKAARRRKGPSDQERQGDLL
jgi:16S rRNA G966 N2-methylase RsmD